MSVSDIEEQIREMEDFRFDFSRLAIAASSEKVKEIRFYTEIPEIENAITALNKLKIKPITLLK